MSNSSKVVFALLTGIASGTVFGILIAPDKGRQSRQLLRKSVKELKSLITERTADEFYHLHKWKARMVNLVKTQLFGPETEIPDDLEHG
jgi:gas vesicle protein